MAKLQVGEEKQLGYKTMLVGIQFHKTKKPGHIAYMLFIVFRAQDMGTVAIFFVSLNNLH